MPHCPPHQPMNPAKHTLLTTPFINNHPTPPQPWRHPKQS